jgi:hypothetical protein
LKEGNTQVGVPLLYRHQSYFITLKLKERYYKEVYKYRNSYLQNNDNGNTDHKFKMLGFVANELHSAVHSNRAAERGEPEKCRFSRSVLGVVLCRNFVVAANHDGNK